MTPMLSESWLKGLMNLQAHEQKAANEFALLFLRDPKNPGISFERLGRSSGDNLWSGRVTQDLRAIIYHKDDRYALLWVDHHDDAYDWAEKRTVEINPQTGAMQIVATEEVIREVEREIVNHQYLDPPLFEGRSDDYLLSLGLPASYLPAAREVRNGDDALQLCEILPEGVAERILTLAAGEYVTPPPAVVSTETLRSPDTRRSFRLIDDESELRAILDAPLEKWIAFLHPSQRSIVEKKAGGPIKVSGSAGTGKTVVALHRTRQLARQGERVFLTSYVRTLCDNLRSTLGMICTPEELDRISVTTLHHQALALLQQIHPAIQPDANAEYSRRSLERRAALHSDRFSLEFFRSEWDHVILAQGIESWEEYRDARRIGRGTPLSVRDRHEVWKVFAGVQEDLEQAGLRTWSGLCSEAAALLEVGKVAHPFTAVVVDEVQDLSVPELRFLRALAGDRPENLMLVGDVGQRIYPGGYSLETLGIPVRGRSYVLRINYRTTEQIRRAADLLRSDDPGTEELKTTSLLGGPEPILTSYDSTEDEDLGVLQQVKSWLDDTLAPYEIGIFARSGKRLDSIVKRLQEQGLPIRRLSTDAGTGRDGLHLGTMHRAKGLEFKGVVALDCSKGSIPTRHVAGITDPQDRESALHIERNLLYVVMTRARQHLAVGWVGKPSPFLEALLIEEKSGMHSKNIISWNQNR